MERCSVSKELFEFLSDHYFIAVLFCGIHGGIRVIYDLFYGGIIGRYDGADAKTDCYMFQAFRVDIDSLLFNFFSYLFRKFRYMFFIYIGK